MIVLNQSLTPCKYVSQRLRDVYVQVLAQKKNTNETWRGIFSGALHCPLNAKQVSACWSGQSENNLYYISLNTMNHHI